MSKTDQFIGKGLECVEGVMSAAPSPVSADNKTFPPSQTPSQWGATAGGWAQTAVTRK